MNISTQKAMEDGNSMYLSFDSTYSESAYKTLAGDEASNIANYLDEDDSKGNTTLVTENHNNENDNIMKDVINTSSSEVLPLRFIKSPIFSGVRMLSSTPSKEKMLFNRERKSGGAASDSKLHIEQKDKENTSPFFTEDSMPSFSSSTVLELQLQKKKLASAEVPKSLTSDNNVCSGTTEKSVALPTMTVSVERKGNAKLISRKSICEPNLEANRPSRIKAGPKKTRFSLVRESQFAGSTMGKQTFNQNKPTVCQIFPEIKEEGDVEIPFIKFSNPPPMSDSDTNIKPNSKIGANSEKSNVRKTNNFTQRKSLLPTIIQQDKRGTPAKSRLSNVVKTTLNSSTRKTTRKSLVPTANAVSKRRSLLVLQSKLTSPLTKKTVYGTSSGEKIMGYPREVGGSDEVTRPLTRSSVAPTRRSIYTNKTQIEDIYVCPECKAIFKKKFLLDAHKRTHQTLHAERTEVSRKSPRKLSTSANSSGNNPSSISSASGHQCKYCDKSFALERALHIHLLQNCEKIPAAERRKLNFTEMNHVEKAETPHFSSTGRKQKTTTTTAAQTTVKDPLSNLPVKRYGLKEPSVTGVGLLYKNKNDLSRYSVSKSSEADSKREMAPPQPHSVKVKKKTAHSGVYRTPNKDIPCRSCNKSFKSIMDYTNHVMLMHSTSDVSSYSTNEPLE